jgi:hypothetical protein
VIVGEVDGVLGVLTGWLPTDDEADTGAEVPPCAVTETVALAVITGPGPVVAEARNEALMLAVTPGREQL